jgi:beta-xylosidase
VLLLVAVTAPVTSTECAAADVAAPASLPVVRQDWPDPGVVSVQEGGTTAHYLVSTGGRFPIRRSVDLLTWEETGAAVMPSGRAPWSPDGARNWAPEIHLIGGRFVAYYAASSAPSSTRADPLAIGAAWADDVLGPYHHLEQPLVGPGVLGVIDASAFTDSDGTPYLYWKTDGNCCGVPTEILVQRLSTDGLSFAPGSQPTSVLRNDLEWEGAIVEAPWVERRGGSYYLFYSANDYHEPYRTGIARASSPLGPFVKQPEPLLSSNAWMQGPGHGSVVQRQGEDFFVHHGWVGGRGRYLFVSRLAWVDGWPVVSVDAPLRPL